MKRNPVGNLKLAIKTLFDVYGSSVDQNVINYLNLTIRNIVVEDHNRKIKNN